MSLVNYTRPHRDIGDPRHQQFLVPPFEEQEESCPPKSAKLSSNQCPSWQPLFAFRCGKQHRLRGIAESKASARLTVTQREPEDRGRGRLDFNKPEAYCAVRLDSIHAGVIRKEGNECSRVRRDSEEDSEATAPVVSGVDVADGRAARGRGRKNSSPGGCIVAVPVITATGERTPSHFSLQVHRVVPRSRDALKVPCLVITPRPLGVCSLSIVPFPTICLIASLNPSLYSSHRFAIAPLISAPWPRSGGPSLGPLPVCLALLARKATRGRRE